MELALVVLVVVVALGFGYTNGFHDAANSVATSVSTRALTPRIAVLMAAVFNLVGALLSEGVARTIGSGIIRPDQDRGGLLVVLAGLLGAIAWNLWTWWRGLPSSSSHVLIGGLLGAGLASATTVEWEVVLTRVVVPLVVVPLVGFALAYLLMVAVLWVFRHSLPGRTNRRFRMAQTASAAAMALGHGLQDAQKTMGVIVLALVAGGYHTGEGIPLWVKLVSAVALSLGTYAGGWRIMRTLGRRVIDLDPPRGFVAETVASAMLYAAAVFFRAPVSTTHTITASIMGVGATARVSAVRWRVAGSILRAWVLTVPASAAVAALCYLVLDAAVS